MRKQIFITILLIIMTIFIAISILSGCKSNNTGNNAISSSINSGSNSSISSISNSENNSSTGSADSLSSSSTGSSNISNDTKAAEKISIKIGALKGPSIIGMVKLIDDNPVLGENITSDYEIVQSPDVMTSRLLSKEIDIAVLPTNVAAKLYDKGVEIKLAAVTGGGVLYLVADDNEKINQGNWNDLKNKKISITSKGSNPDVIFRYLASKNNIDTKKDLTLEYSADQVELTQLLIAGRSGIGVLPEPFATSATLKNSSLKIVMNIQEEWKKTNSGNELPQTCLVVKSGFLKENPAAIENFLNNYKNSIEWANSNPEEAGSLAEKYQIGIDEKIARDVIPRCNLMFLSNLESEKIVSDYLKTIYGFSPDDVGGLLPDEEFYYVKK